MSRLQNQDFKTEAQLISGGATAASLLNDTKVYVTALSINKTLDDAILDGDIGGGATINDTNQAIAGGGTITIGTGKDRVLHVSGSGGPVDASATPFGASPPASGWRVTLIGTDSTNTLTILNNDAANGCLLKGSAELARGSALTLVYSGNLSRYVEISRSL